MEDGSDHKKAKGTKKCVIKQKLMLENYKIACLTIKQYINHRKDLKNVLSSNDDKRLQTPDKITTYPYGTDEMMIISK